MVIALSEFVQRREQLLSKLGSGVAVFRSAPHAVMHNDVEYRYRQDSDFYYLTGLDEPESVAVLAPNHEHKFVLFVRPRDPAQETWVGYRLGVEGAKEKLGADAVFSIADLDQELPKLLETGDRLYYHLGRDRAFDERMLQFYQQQLALYPRRGFGPIAIADPGPLLHSLRQVKSPAEIEQLRKAIAIAVEAHDRARAIAAPGVWEYEVEAAIEGCFRQRGAQGVAYPSIVAAGANACILHYIDNNQQLQDGDLLLIDAGCSTDYYNSDLTRTFPVNGRFSDEQRALYSIVLEAQKRAIAAVQAGAPYGNFHEAAVRTLIDGLLDLGLLQGDPAELYETGAYRPFYMHRTGHWLGMDVHDVGTYQYRDSWTTLAPGHVVTVEPGLYISPTITVAEGQPEVPERWRGIGIRIEDDVLVQADGPEVLSADLVKEIADLERSS
ncbi:aminopeptidase P N-terminal domain-containing protein [Synechococcus elongatus]|uniref:aminopeptidase P N-terminal domain-containing protein n=1 Tax=Synechococcus elongatus TaxID=32046 RepID=UPI0030D4CF5C